MFVWNIVFLYIRFVILARQHEDLQVPGVAEMNSTGISQLCQPSRTSKLGTTYSKSLETRQTKKRAQYMKNILADTNPL